MFLRFFNLAWSSVLILSAAAGCTFPGGTNTGGNTSVPASYGVIKVIDQGGKKQIGAANFLEAKDYESGETVTDRGLSKIAGGVLYPGSQKDEYYLLSQKQGIYYTENAGQLWRRIYVFSLESTKETPEERATDRESQLAKNNAFAISGFYIDTNDSNIMYVGGLLGSIGKLYKSTNKGKTFEEKYSEVNQNVAVTRVVTNPKNSFDVLAVIGSDTILKSSDAGQTWSKIYVFNAGGSILQFGFLPYLNNVLYVFQNGGGLSFSPDLGATWSNVKMEREPSKINEKQPTDTFSFGNNDSLSFASFERFLPVKATPGKFMMLADKQLWSTDDITQPWKKINLPLQGEQNTISALDVDPQVGLDKIYLTIQNKLFVSLNRGESWSSETLPISVPVVKIVVDQNDTSVLYMSLGAAN
jgi:photosystem II stability/assembly factor-like uncharacterized protein